MKKELEKEQERAQVSEVENETSQITISNHIVDYDDDEVKINETKGLSEKKDIQA